MIKIFVKTSAIFQRADFLSPKDLLQRAGAISVIFSFLHLAGLREFTSILNGTVGSLALGWKLSAFLAVIYVLSYLAFVVLVPVLILAAMILLAWQRCCKKSRKIESEKDP
jgi:UDP-N-acetylmuramyl pentapeptide phosphotransferase/UDP-N-acetylglucosamine-1-phosphate transferase